MISYTYYVLSWRDSLHRQQLQPPYMDGNITVKTSEQRLSNSVLQTRVQKLNELLKVQQTRPALRRHQRGRAPFGGIENTSSH